VKEDEMDGACYTYGGEGGRGMYIGFWWESQKERGHLEDLDVGGRITLYLILEQYDGVVWTRFMWLRIGTSGGLL
jgi:hypothetical protein